MGNPEPSEGRLRASVWALGATALLCGALLLERWCSGRFPAFLALLPALQVATFLAIPMAAILRGADLESLGLAGIAPGRCARVTLAAACLTLLPFAAGFRLLHGQPPAEPVDWRALAAAVPWELLAVGFPEEIFFRGCLQSRLDAAFGRPWRLGGARAGPGLLLAAACFALAHLALQGPGPVAAATFLPGLVFGYVRAAGGGVYGAAALHVLSNVMLRGLLGSGG